MSAVKWGILGTARIAAVQAIPAIRESARGEAFAIASRSIEQARATAARFEIARAYGSYEQLLADPEVEAIYIPLPNHLHAEWTVRAADAGKHVLCEKPLTLTAAEVDALIEARDRNGVIIQEAFVFPHHPRWQRARALIRAGAVGTPRAIQAAFTHYNDDPANIRNQVDLPGSGGMMDLGCYAIAGARYLFDADPRRALALMDTDPRLGVDRLGTALLDFGEGRQASFVVGKQTARQQWLSLTGSEARLELPNAFHPPRGEPSEIRISSREGTAPVQTEQIEPCSQFVLQSDAFCRVIRGEQAQELPLEDAVANMRALDAIFRSAASGGWGPSRARPVRGSMAYALDRGRTPRDQVGEEEVEQPASFLQPEDVEVEGRGQTEHVELHERAVLQLDCDTAAGEHGSAEVVVYDVLDRLVVRDLDDRLEARVLLGKDLLKDVAAMRAALAQEDGEMGERRERDAAFVRELVLW